MVWEIEMYTQVDCFVLKYIGPVVVYSCPEGFGGETNILFFTLSTGDQVDNI